MKNSKIKFTLSTIYTFAWHMFINTIQEPDGEPDRFGLKVPTVFPPTLQIDDDMTNEIIAKYEKLHAKDSITEAFCIAENYNNWCKYGNIVTPIETSIKFHRNRCSKYLTRVYSDHGKINYHVGFFYLLHTFTHEFVHYARLLEKYREYIFDNDNETKSDTFIDKLRHTSGELGVNEEKITERITIEILSYYSEMYYPISSPSTDKVGKILALILEEFKYWYDYNFHEKLYSQYDDELLSNISRVQNELIMIDKTSSDRFLLIE